MLHLFSGIPASTAPTLNDPNGQPLGMEVELTVKTGLAVQTRLELLLDRLDLLNTPYLASSSIRIIQTEKNVFLDFANSLETIVKSTTGFEDWTATQLTIVRALQKIDNILALTKDNDTANLLSLRTEFLNIYLQAMDSLASAFQNDALSRFLYLGQLLKIAIVNVNYNNNSIEHLFRLNAHIEKFIALYHILPTDSLDDGSPLLLINSTLNDIVKVLCKVISSKSLLSESCVLSTFIAGANHLINLLESGDKPLADEYKNKIEMIEFLYHMQIAPAEFDANLAAISVLANNKFLQSLQALQKGNEPTPPTMTRKMIVDLLQTKMQKQEIPPNWHGVADFRETIARLEKQTSCCVS